MKINMIITENEKTAVIFSSLFDRHYPALFNQLSNILWNHHKGFSLVCHTNDYWVRDFMPVQMNENVFAKFIFNPDYLQDKKKYITDVDKVINSCPFAKDFVFVNIPLVMDGGNMVFCKGRRNHPHSNFVIMTEKVLNENPNYDKTQIEDILKCTFMESNLTIVWLPWDREDVFGHTDGIVRYVGVNKEGKPKVLVNLEPYEDEIANQMYTALAEHFEVIELKLSEYDDMSWAYINSLLTQDFIIIPSIGNAITDAEAMAQYRELFPEYNDNIYMVQMRDFIAQYGGALNCLTWTFYEDIFKSLATEKYVEKNDPKERTKLPVQITLEDMTKENQLIVKDSKKT